MTLVIRIVFTYEWNVPLRKSLCKRFFRIHGGKYINYSDISITEHIQLRMNSAKK